MLCHPGLSTRSQIGLSAGLGLGLDAVQAIITELGGRLGMSTEPGQGTRFYLRLP